MPAFDLGMLYGNVRSGKSLEVYIQNLRGNPTFTWQPMSFVCENRPLVTLFLQIEPFTFKKGRKM